jgi:FkbM family methyltransferase
VISTLKLWRKKSNPGFFVEVGGADGVHFSNTLILEKNFGWDGIIVEPSKFWKELLLTNRECKMDLRCVTGESGLVVNFTEAPNALYSTISEYLGADSHHASRVDGINYKVNTVSLGDLLNSHGAPTIVDYLSLDTEGSEFEILEHFDFTRWQFKIITVEHNYTMNREKVSKLLQKNGYEIVFRNRTFMDEWFVKKELLKSS